MATTKVKTNRKVNDKASRPAAGSGRVPSTSQPKPTRSVASGARAYITAGFNNTIITITDLEGRTLCWGSSGTAGFKGTRKSTPFAATRAIQSTAEKAYQMGARQLSVYIKGPGAGRGSAVKALRSAGLAVRMIADVTPIPHNGCRPRKRRRV